MPAFTAEQASINNGSKVVQINSGESVANIRSGDFLVLAGFIVEINRAFVGAANEQLIELVQAWSHSTQSNQSCIVIPTTAEFKTVVAALNEANMLVNSNYKAMQDWQTKTGTVTFENKDGTTTTVKTLKQIEADNQAQMDAYHPYPWAMRKVEFEAIRAANNEKFAASGFVHKGKKLDSSNYIKVNEGFYTGNIATGDFLDNLHLGVTADSAMAIGNSKTNYATVNIAGVVTKIEHLSIIHPNIASNIKLPPTEDGARTYDSATGVSVKHASASIAFASETDTNKVVTERVDLWGFEAFLREINDADPFVYNNGLIQSQAASINSVNTVNDIVRPASYFAWYEGDIASRGKGVNWQTANEAQRIGIASDPNNNIFFDDETGKFYQWCVRGRSFAGVGNGDWGDINAATNLLSLRYDLYNRVAVQGKADIPHTGNPFVDNTGHHYYGEQASATLTKNQIGLFRPFSNTMAAYGGVDGECFFFVGGTQSRLNQGAYHPSINSLGSNRFVRVGSEAAGGDAWDVTTKQYSTLADCMILEQDGGARANKDFGRMLYQASGRPDGRYYDANYPDGQGGVCRDMCFSACGIKQEDFAEADLAIKSGKYRGHENLPFVKVGTLTQVANSVFSDGVTKLIGNGQRFSSDFVDWKSYNATAPNKDMSLDGCYVIGANGIPYSIQKYGIQVDTDSVCYLTGNVTQYFPAGTYHVVLMRKDTGLPSISNEYTHTEVIGSPANILLCEDLKNGWVGTWCAEIPDGTSKNFKLTRPAQSSQSYPSPYSLDNGANWVATPRTIDLVTNSIQNVAWPGDFVTAINYKAKAKLTHNSANSKIFGNLSGIGLVIVSSRARDETARGLAYSLTDKIVTSQNISGDGTDHQYIPLEELQLGDGLDKLLGINQIIGQHGVTSLATPQNNSPAFKALNYNVVENQQAFINYAYTELKHNGTDWGDDGKVHIADNQTTMLDENGNTVLVGTARCVEPLGWIKNDK